MTKEEVKLAFKTGNGEKITEALKEYFKLQKYAKRLIRQDDPDDTFVQAQKIFGFAS